jgi:VWFA-related protein
MKSVAALLCATCSLIRAQQAPVFSSETKVVLVDVAVTGKKGEYVRDLTARDFRVWEDNKEQTIKSFTVEGDSSAAEPRRLVLFFDNTGMSAADQASERQTAASFIDASFMDAKTGPNWLMAVVNFDDGFRVAQSFTENAARLKEAVRAVRITASSSALATRETAMGTAGANARGLIQAVGNLARNLNAVPGRKIIVLFTGSAPAAAVQQADVASLVQISNRSNVAIYPVLQGGVGIPTGTSSDCGGPQQGFNAIRNPAPAPACRPDDSVAFTLAGGTGGFVVTPSNNLLAQLQKIGAEQRQSYVLGYQPLESKEGTCHTLRVKVDRGGTEVRARSGYCTSKPQDLLAESRVEQDLEKGAAGPQTGSAASIQAPFFYVAPNVARVHVAMEIATEALKFENLKGKLHAEMNILGIASAPGGDVAARFSDIVKREFDSKPDLDNWKAKPLHYEKEFKIVPGQYHLTVVFSSGGTNFGKVETPLAVPAYDRSQFAISGLALSREVRPASELGLEAALIDEGTPLIAGGMQVTPTGSNAFAKSEQAFCYFEIYSPRTADAATIHLRIVESKTGAQKWDGGVAKLDPPAGGKSTLPAGLSVPIASLPSGSYKLEVTATDGADKTAQRTVDFEIE